MYNQQTQSSRPRMGYYNYSDPGAQVVPPAAGSMEFPGYSNVETQVVPYPQRNMEFPGQAVNDMEFPPILQRMHAEPETSWAPNPMILLALGLALLAYILRA